MISRTHVFAIGVEEYQRGELACVAYAESDARDFARAWAGLGVGAADSVLLLGKEASQDAVATALEKMLGTIAADDTFVFFYSGHILGDGDPGLPLARILAQLAECRAGKALLFIDPASGNVSSPSLQQFVEGSSNRFAFVACGEGESSLKSTKLNHGIWAAALIEALLGNAKEAVEGGALITCKSLQDHLATAVPQLIRSTRAGTETQSPVFYGISKKQIEVADLAGLAGPGTEDDAAFGNALKDTFLRGEIFGLVRNLSGFRKGHQVPDRHFQAAEKFVRQIGHEKVQQQADTIFKNLRTAFAYRRKETVFDCVDGAATIKTPDFDVDLSIAQEPGDAAGYVVRVEVGHIRTPEKVLTDEFSEVFSEHCDVVVISLAQPLDVEGKIDDIESSSLLRGYLDYDADCTSFTLKLPAPSITILVTPNEITLRQRGPKNLKALLNGLQTALGTLNESGVLELTS